MIWSPEPKASQAGQTFIVTGANAGIGLETGRRYVVPGNKNIEASDHAIAASCLQAIPPVVKAKPGILPLFHTTHHWVPDLRNV